MRLDVQEQLTALNRFMNDLWAATSRSGGEASFRRVMAALDDWGLKPEQAIWRRFEKALRAEVGPEAADNMIADLSPYFRSSDEKP